MAETPSTMLPLGTTAPDFELIEPLTGKARNLAEFRGGKGLAVFFICNHCPYVKHLRAKLAELGREYQGQGIQFVAMSSNDAGKYPADSPEKMADEARDAGYPFPYLYDETQAVAKAYRAACTPDIYLFDSQLKLVYRGQFDDSRPGNGKPVTGVDLKNAMDAVLAGRAISTDQKPSVGCNIKWKPGNTPEYS